MKLAAVAALAFVLGLALGSRRPCADQTAAESIWAAAVRDPKFRAAMATGKADFAAGRASPFREFRRTPGDWATDSYTEGLVRP